MSKLHQKISKSFPSWEECCGEAGHKFVKKGTLEYNNVKKIFDEYRDVGLTDDEKKSRDLWKKACSHFNFPYVMKGTLQYDKVRAYFFKLIEREGGDN